MKKVCCLILSAVMLLSLSACGKSKEAAKVDDLILSIGEVSLESNEAIVAAEDAYNTLTDKDKADVEHYSDLKEAKSEFENILYTSIADDLSEMNAQCNELSSAVLQVWDNVGPEYFTTVYIAILRFEDENSLEEMKQKAQKPYDWFKHILTAGMGLNRDEYESVDINDDVTIDEIVEQCIHITRNYWNVNDTNEKLNTQVSEYIKSCKEEWPDKSDLLREWYLESSLYADSVLNPSGSYASYSQNRFEYIEEMKRFQKEANSFN